MDLTYLFPIVNILLVVAFIIDRLFRLRSIKEYKEAKEAQIDHLKQQLEIERKNNDIEITEMHKKRYESLKVILDEKEIELENNKNVLLALQSSLDTVSKEVDLKAKLYQQLLQELNKVEKAKHTLEIEKKALEQQIAPTILIPEFGEPPARFRMSNRPSSDNEERHPR